MSAKIEAISVESLERQLVRTTGCVHHHLIRGVREGTETRSIAVTRKPRRKGVRTPAQLELIIQVVALITITQKEPAIHRRHLFVAHLTMIWREIVPYLPRPDTDLVQERGGGAGALPLSRHQDQRSLDVNVPSVVEQKEGHLRNLVIRVTNVRHHRLVYGRFPLTMIIAIDMPTGLNPPDPIADIEAGRLLAPQGISSGVHLHPIRVTTYHLETGAIHHVRTHDVPPSPVLSPHLAHLLDHTLA